jgi:superfamily II DNA/RNA helicase
VSRLLDLTDEGALSLFALIVVAVDECDKMLHLGFSQQLQRLAHLLLLAQIPAAADSGGARVTGAADPCGCAESSKQTNGQQTGVSLSGTDVVPNHRKRRRRSADELLVPVSTAQVRPASPGPVRRPQVLLVSATLPANWQKTAGEWISAAAHQVNLTTGGVGCISKAVTQASSHLPLLACLAI